MVVALGFLITIALIAWLKKPYVSILLLLFLLPHQYILKKVFDNQFSGGDIFSVWKEMIIIILLCKVKIKDVKNLVSIRLYILAFICLSIVYFALSNDYVGSLANLRSYIFPFLLFIACAFSDIDIPTPKLIKTLFASCFLVVILGIVQHFFLNIPISMYKGSIDFIDEGGYIQYAANSFRIMGIERMSGGFSGPNDFGVYLSIPFLIQIILLVFSAEGRIRISLFERLSLYTLMLGTFICLALSFSRAGWAIAIIGSGIMLTFFTRNKAKVGLYVGLLIGLMIFAIPFFSDKISEIFINSVSMKEDSAQDRSDQFNRGAGVVITEPYGHGVGSSDFRSKENISFFVESAWWNMGYEIGLLGMILYIIINTSILKKAIGFKNKSKNIPVLFPYDYLAIMLIVPTVLVGFVSINPNGTTYLFYYWLFCGLAFRKLTPSNVVMPIHQKVDADEAMPVVIQ